MNNRSRVPANTHLKPWNLDFHLSSCSFERCSNSSGSLLALVPKLLTTASVYSYNIIEWINFLKYTYVHFWLYICIWNIVSFMNNTNIYIYLWLLEPGKKQDLKWEPANSTRWRNNLQINTKSGISHFSFLNYTLNCIPLI